MHISHASVGVIILLLPCLAIKLAARRGLPHDIADLLFLGVSEAVATHLEFRESGLPGEQDEQQCHALVPSEKPSSLQLEGKVLQGVDLGVSEGLQELVPVLCPAASGSNEQRVEAATPSHGLGGEVEDEATVDRCRTI